MSHLLVVPWVFVAVSTRDVSLYLIILTMVVLAGFLLNDLLHICRGAYFHKKWQALPDGKQVRLWTTFLEKEDGLTGYCVLGMTTLGLVREFSPAFMYVCSPNVVSEGSILDLHYSCRSGVVAVFPADMFSEISKVFNRVDVPVVLMTMPEEQRFRYVDSLKTTANKLQMQFFFDLSGLD